MRPGDTFTLAALLFLVVVGWLRRISLRQQRQITGLALLGTALIATTLSLSKYFPASAKAVGDWLPCILLLIVYWQAGRFLGAPNEKLQAWLVGFDRRRLGRFLESLGPQMEHHLDWELFRTCLPLLLRPDPHGCWCFVLGKAAQRHRLVLGYGVTGKLSLLSDCAIRANSAAEAAARFRERTGYEAKDPFS